MPVVDAVELYRFFHPGDSEVAALQGVSLSLFRGDLTVVLGPSGSGKSTLLNLLAGLDEPDGGYVEIAGKRLSRRPERVRAGIRARHIGMLMQSGNLVDHLTIADNIRLQRALAGKQDCDGKIVDLAARLGLSGHWNALPSQLSGGEMARAGLAVALSSEPDVLLCDEPTAEVDADTEQHLIAVLAERCAAGAAVFVATHSAALARTADQVLHLKDGRLIDA